MRFDPCEAVRYVVRRQSGPPNGFELIQEAFQRVADASGYSFQFEGFTDQLPDDHFSSAGSADPPVWLGWAFDDEGVELSKDVNHIGSGGPSYDARTGKSATGFVVLRADVPMDHSFGPGRTTGNVLLHEIGHLLGLDHSTSDLDQLFPTLTDRSPDGLGPGDLSGLYEIGSSPCFT